MVGDRLRVAVTAPPVDGAANAAVVRALAEALGVPRRAVTIVRGETGRRKTVRIEGPDASAGRRRLAVARACGPAVCPSSVRYRSPSSVWRLTLGDLPAGDEDRARAGERLEGVARPDHEVGGRAGGQAAQLLRPRPKISAGARVTAVRAASQGRPLATALPASRRSVRLKWSARLRGRQGQLHAGLRQQGGVVQAGRQRLERPGQVGQRR